MVVIVAAGDPLAHHVGVRVADILDRLFPRSPALNPESTSFWTLNMERGSPPELTDDDVKTAEDALDVVAAGRAIATAPASVAIGLAHPGVIALSHSVTAPRSGAASSGVLATTIRSSTRSSTSPLPGHARAERTGRRPGT